MAHHCETKLNSTNPEMFGAINNLNDEKNYSEYIKAGGSTLLDTTHISFNSILNTCEVTSGLQRSPCVGAFDKKKKTVGNERTSDLC